MNLSNMANFVCGKVGRTDSASLSACKGFIGRRYELIFDSQLWRDSLATASLSVPAGQQDVYLPSEIDRVIAIRWSDRTLNPVQHEAIYYLDPTLFDRTGTPTSFVVMPKGIGLNSPQAISELKSVIRLVEKPNSTKSLTVLGKTKTRIFDEVGFSQYRTLTQDQDQPVLRGIDHGLLAYAEGDMLTRERQYGKAQLMYQEAASTLRVAFNLERGQEASEVQVSPTGSGEWTRDDWDMPFSGNKNDLP